MAEEEAKKVDPEPCAEAPPVAAPVAAEPVESPKDVAEEKAVIPAPPPVEEKADESKALAIVESKSSTLYHTSLLISSSVYVSISAFFVSFSANFVGKSFLD